MNAHSLSWTGDPDGVDVAVRLVGDVRVMHRDREVAPRVVGCQRCVEVFDHLAVHRHRDVHLDELASVVWPADRSRSWNAAIRGILSRVRDSLEIAGLAPDIVRSRGGYVRLTLPAGIVSDLEHARRRSDTTSDDPVDLVRDARAVLGLAIEDFDRATDHLEDALHSQRENGFEGWYAETLCLAHCWSSAGTGGRRRRPSPAPAAPPTTSERRTCPGGSTR